MMSDRFLPDATNMNQALLVKKICWGKPKLQKEAGIFYLKIYVLLWYVLFFLSFLLMGVVDLIRTFDAVLFDVCSRKKRIKYLPCLPDRRTLFVLIKELRNMNKNNFYCSPP